MNRIHKSISKPTVPLAAIIVAVLFSVLDLNSQQLQQGISVHLAPTINAKPAPEADTATAWVVSVTSDGRLWFGTTPVTPDALANTMIQTPRNREQNLYIKADALAPYSDVVQVLKAAHVVGFESPVLLTSQPASAQPNGLMSPMGLQVWIENGALTGPRPVELEISSNHGSPTVKVNTQEVQWENLRDTLSPLSRNQAESVVRLKADGEVPFGEVARAIDAARASGAKVLLAIPSI